MKFDRSSGIGGADGTRLGGGVGAGVGPLIVSRCPRALVIKSKTTTTAAWPIAIDRLPAFGFLIAYIFLLILAEELETRPGTDTKTKGCTGYYGGSGVESITFLDRPRTLPDLFRACLFHGFPMVFVVSMRLNPRPRRLGWRPF